jgi:hypothetical protein
MVISQKMSVLEGFELSKLKPTFFRSMPVPHPDAGSSARAPVKHATLTVPAFSDVQLSTVHIFTALTSVLHWQRGISLCILSTLPGGNISPSHM